MLRSWGETPEEFFRRTNTNEYPKLGELKAIYERYSFNRSTELPVSGEIRKLYDEALVEIRPSGSSLPSRIGSIFSLVSVWRNRRW